ncbi:hypothetical protein I5Q34_03940 [Streptomyces sp. AV19]|uniref:DUF6255 family natural product biosynthesis protein n=1 Tax=Streptomyces sp. AV19 TaxID=2793068 RepID=UPI0018FEC652|nr:DUF6255 family natural product biosynthesis protein [Streptomyces sp. AV19]MBH1933445.1 hypothetical protein [Streptomyces sp. AV19]MDG4532094.1 DUF6255 family natural product biosynthesis protein [Streptomyces sp. AV19]
MTNDCTHASGWERTDGGAQQCRDCGTRRFTDYGALRPPGPAPVVRPSPEDARRADRAAAIVISRTIRHISRWGHSAAAFWAAA